MWIYWAASATICLRRSQGYDVEARDPFHTGLPILEEAIVSTARTSVVLAIVALCVPLPLCAAGFDRVELNVPDPPAVARWYANHLGGRLVQLESAPAVAFGKITLSFAKADGPISDSVGSGIDHLGFSYANIDTAMERFSRDGVRIVSGVEKDGPVRYAFIHDPWSTLIEVVEDPQIRGFHHIHLATTDPKTTLKFYTDVFGGKVSRFAGLIGGIRQSDAWILVKGTNHKLAMTKGRGIDHVSWPVADFDATVERLRAKQVPFESPARDTGAARSLFVVGPEGVRLEIVHRTAD
jgi:catechol 2,3-dioxygenase-like lactoylglutathione lyase family enzyme